MIFAHVAGVPVEEILPTLAGASTALLVARGWLRLRPRSRRAPARSSGG